MNQCSPVCAKNLTAGVFRQVQHLSKLLLLSWCIVLWQGASANAQCEHEIAAAILETAASSAEAGLAPYWGSLSMMQANADAMYADIQSGCFWLADDYAALGADIQALCAWLNSQMEAIIALREAAAEIRSQCICYIVIVPPTCPTCNQDPCVCNDPCTVCYNSPCVCPQTCLTCYSSPCVCTSMCYTCYQNPCTCNNGGSE